MSKSVDVMEKIVALCRRRGFIFGSSEIYGGIGGFWDYGPLGCELKKNIKDAWWNDMVRNPPPGPGGREFQMVGVDCSIIMNPKVWEASGHVGGFADKMIACRTEGCKRLFRADKAFCAIIAPADAFGERAEKLLAEIGTSLVEAWVPSKKQPTFKPRQITFEADAVVDCIEAVQAAFKSTGKRSNDVFLKELVLTERTAAPMQVIAARDSKGNLYGCQILDLGSAATVAGLPCPACGGELAEAKAFNLMFESHAGAVKDDANKVYLRPETAQGIFANFKNVMDSTRVKIPFGIAQVGKAFRNEINPRNYTFRSREFEQMEIEFFCKPDESMTWYEFWRDARINWYTSLGIKSDKLRPRQQGDKELAHYSRACTDIEYLFPFSEEPQELEGVAHRGSFDLNQHGKFSKNDENAFAVIDEEAPLAPGEKRDKFVPHVIEPSAGADRFTLAVICEAYSFDESRASPEFMKFHPRLAPIKAAVFPLVAKDGLPEIGEPLYNELRKHYVCQYDAKQSIGKRYARMDEAGTPFCFTIDGQTKDDGTVTVRSRDDASQKRIDKSRCLEFLRDQLHI